MRIYPIHQNTTAAPTRGASIELKKSLVGLMARINASPSDPVSATFSVLGTVESGLTYSPLLVDNDAKFEQEPILFGGASIISLSGTGSAQWTGRIENNFYSNISLDLLTLSTLTSFRAVATEAE